MADESLIFKIGVDLGPFKQGMGQVKGLATKAGNMAGMAVKAAFAAAVGAVSAGGLLAKGVLEAGAEFETLSTRLTTLMGSADAARVRMEELATIGQRTPFELPGIVEAEASLRGFGVDAEEVLPKVLDLSAALGLELSDAAGAVGRAFAGGAGAADVLRERGVLAAIELRTGIKATNMEIGQFREELLTTLEDYEGGADDLSKTLEGQVSNLKDAWGAFQRQVADASFYDATKAAIGEVNRLMLENKEAIDDIAQATGYWLKGSLMFVVKTAGDLVGYWLKAKAAVKSIEGVVYGLDAATAQWGATALRAAADLMPIQGAISDAMRANAAANDRHAEIARGKMNTVRDEIAGIKQDIKDVDKETEGILKTIEEAGTGGSTRSKNAENRKKQAEKDAEAEAKALKERQKLIDEILKQYHDDEKKEFNDRVAQRAKDLEKGLQLQIQKEKDHAKELLRIARETAAERSRIANQTTAILNAATVQGVNMRLNEEATGAEISRAISLSLFSDLLRQLSAYLATRAAAAAVSLNPVRAAAFAAGSAVAAGGAAAVDAQAQAQASEAGEETRSVTLGSSGGGRGVVDNTAQSDGGLADAADALRAAARDLSGAARDLSRSASRGGGGGDWRTSERALMGRFPSFSGA